MSLSGFACWAHNRGCRAGHFTLGFNRNNIKHAKRKRVAPLVNAQLALDKEAAVNAAPTPHPRRSLRLNPMVSPAPD